jgi:hypothetical protein
MARVVTTFFYWLRWVGIGLSLAMSSAAIALQVLAARRRRRLDALRRDLARSQPRAPRSLPAEAPPGFAVPEKREP